MVTCFQRYLLDGASISHTYHMQYGDANYQTVMKISNIQYIITEIQNGCHSAILSKINPKI